MSKWEDWSLCWKEGGLISWVNSGAKKQGQKHVVWLDDITLDNQNTEIMS